jgi:hypothetical protein
MIFLQNFININKKMSEKCKVCKSDAKHVATILFTSEKCAHKDLTLKVCSTGCAKFFVATISCSKEKCCKNNEVIPNKIILTNL